jgi:pantoate--beta-alanine ligase
VEIIRTIKEMSTFYDTHRKNGKSIGLIPTMGALHVGHVSLVKKSKLSCDISVCSIFVNPIQFNNPEDLKKYPRNEKKDLDMLKDAGCDAVFIPHADDMFQPNQITVKIDFGSLENEMEGKFRPGHFSGVGVVIAKLFNIVKPDIAYFGEKDLQQLAVVKKLVRDLNFSVKIESVKTFREENGLAMSSRNLLLSKDEKDTASRLFHGLNALKKKLESGHDLESAKGEVINSLNDLVNVEVEYIELVNSDTLEILDEMGRYESLSICAAVMVYGVRIIDNIKIR